VKNINIPSLFAIDLRGLLAQMRQETGQGLAEYALILAFIAVVAVLALTLLGGDISSLLNKVASDF
jgi:pilus assembly protein Flp/PilA